VTNESDAAIPREGRGAGLIAEAQFDWGFVPEQTRRLAHAVDAIDGYAGLIGKFEISSIGPIERQVVYLTTSRENACAYCVAAHSHLARKAGMPSDQIEALRSGNALRDPRLEALHALTSAIVRGKGRVPPAAAEAFVAAGFAREQVFDILLGVAAKMLVNFFNEIAGTPLDEAFQADAWQRSEAPA
jgi:AhpD family alkylhydroperoxidase